MQMRYALVFLHEGKPSTCEIFETRCQAHERARLLGAGTEGKDWVTIPIH